MVSRAIRVMIVDDHTLFREGLRRLLAEYDEMEVVAEAGDGKEALEKVGQLMPDIVLMDIKMPRLDGIEATSMLRVKAPEVRVIALSMYEDAEYVLKAVNAGADGFMQKDVCADRLVSIIKEVNDGRSPAVHLAVNADLLQKVVPLGRDRRQELGLTEQEVRVLRCMADGMSNKEIARGLCISPQTVKWHVSSVLRKMGASDRTQAVAEALRQHLVA